MPRKSSKTAHVMNLLAGDKNTKENETTAKQDEIREEAAGHAPETAPAEAVSKETGAELSDASAIEADPVAELIREKLEEELEQTLKDPEVPEPEAVEPQAEPEMPRASEELVEEEPSYQYVNVMEKIVNDEVIYFMREFDMCMCDRCIADTKALALTNMPAKYIVKEKSAIPPLMNFYANKFIGYVTVELTKACTVVKQIPHHDR